MAEASTSKREEKKQATHRAITDAAWDLFARNGYDDTTVDDIAAAADVSQRTFFRYFDSKEAVLFGAWRDEFDELARRMRERPADESPMAAMLGALISLAGYYKRQRALRIERARLVATSPNVGRYQQVTISPAFQAMLTDALADRLGVDPADDIRPALYAAVGMAVTRTATDRWLEDPDRIDLAELVRAGFAALPGPTS